MSTAQPAPAAAPDSARTRIGLMQILAIPAVDKTIAVVASIPFVYALYRRLAEGNLNIPRACAALGLLVVIVTMLFRRAPQRVTPNPLWWLLAFAATYGPMTWVALAPPGRPIVSAVVTNALAILSLVILLYARLSLGRNIGFVPAQRQLVRSGAYAYVRHPIYTGLSLAWIALVLRLWTPLNLVMMLIFVTLIVIKGLVEEGFLRQDPEYAEYMRQVRHRFVPGLV